MAKTAIQSQLEKKVVSVQHRPASQLGPTAEAVSGILQRAEIAPGSLSLPAVKLLQHTIGNRAVVRLLRPAAGQQPMVSRKFDPQASLQRLLASRGLTVQPKLNVGPAGDQYEQEADHVAEQVMRMPVPQAPPVQHKDDKQAVQTKPLAGAPTLQRLALGFGRAAPIPEDAGKIAVAQNTKRGRDIEAQDVAVGGNVNIPQQVYKDMDNNEAIFLVAHGRPPIANQPAVLESGAGTNLSGSDVAKAVATIRSGLKTEHKSIGEFKIEACMSALSRKTGGGLFGGLFSRKKSSLIMDVKSSLAKEYKVNDIVFRGNLGFAAGNEFEGGVENTTPEGTEVGLLMPLLMDIEKLNNPKKAAHLIADALRILRKRKALINTADSEKPSICQLHEGNSTVDYLRESFEGIKKTGQIEGKMFDVLQLLVIWVKSKAEKAK